MASAGKLSLEMLDYSFCKMKCYDLLSRCCFWHSFVARLERFEFCLVHVRSTQFQVLWMQAFKSSDSGDHLLLLEATRFMYNTQTSSFSYDRVQNDVSRAFSSRTQNQWPQRSPSAWLSFTVSTDMFWWSYLS